MKTKKHKTHKRHFGRNTPTNTHKHTGQGETYKGKTSREEKKDAIDSSASVARFRHFYSAGETNVCQRVDGDDQIGVEEVVFGSLFNSPFTSPSTAKIEVLNPNRFQCGPNS